MVGLRILRVVALLLLAADGRVATAAPIQSTAPSRPLQGTDLMTVPLDLIVPTEVLVQVAQPGISTLPQAVLAVRSAELRDRLVKAPDNAFVMHELGTVIYHQGGRKEAVALWTSANKREPNLAPADLMEAVQGMFALLARGERAQAQKDLRTIEQRFAKQPHFHLTRAEQAMRGGNVKEAEKSYRRAHELAPGLYVTSLNLARFTDLARRDPRSAAKLYEEAARVGAKRPEVWLLLGEFQFRQKQPDAALESFRKVRALSPDSATPERRMGDLSVAAGDYAGARQWYRAALATKPTQAEEDAIRTALGDVLLRLGEPEEARREIELVLKRQELPPLVFALATIDEAQGNTGAAEARYRRVLQLMPGNPLAANNLAMLLIKNGKSPDEALKLAEAANKAIPSNVFIQGTYGCALDSAGRGKEAIKVLGPVVKTSPKDTWSRYCLGSSLLKEKRPVEAKAQFVQVLQEDAKFPRRAELEKLLPSLR